MSGWSMYMLTRSCLTFCDHMDVAPQAPLSMGFPGQEYWSGLSFPSLGDLSEVGTEPWSPALQVGCVLTEPPRKSIR